MKRIAHIGKLLGDIVGFAASNKAWWLVPIVLILLAVAGFALLSSSAAPFIYALF